jgi:large subunit ribosomal protein L4
MKLKVIRTTSRDSSVTADDNLFNKTNDQLLAQAVRVYMSNKRQGTSKTQTRSDVSRTTRKWYRQKGTGNARHGARDATLFVGGAVAHGPTGAENWKKKLTKSQRKQATIAALSAQVQNIVINDEIKDLSGKTKQAFELLNEIVAKFEGEKFNLTKNNLLIIVDKKNEKLNRAVKNIPKVRVIIVDLVNALLIAQADKIILTTDSLETLQEKLTI